jgi:isopentenyldiphosphate isomerase
LREELGVENVALERIGDVVQARLDVADQGIKDYELQQSFRGIFDGEVRPDPGEVCAVDSVPLSELAAAFETRPGDFTPWFRDTAVRLGFCGGRE